jgi:two-component system, OmpR family, phosphate regulon sensor histidine kinase PhoR
MRETEGELTLSGNLQPCVLSADQLHLENVFLNLIDNAIKYSIGKPDIRVDVNCDGHQLQVSFTDRGIGMNAEVRKKIFDTFYRANTGNMHDVKGFGLGLSYVKAIVEAHGGAIDVESEPGIGSVFIVILPINTTSHVS